ncbi:MAG: c-type cytochrome [Candidatus Omnitrophica bacterium]|nr:c-type cytochrome [Candidatus Omnitrophota bacterium]
MKKATVFIFCLVLSLTCSLSNLLAEDQKPALPLGLDPDGLIIPEDNPVTEEKIELGKMLYFDARLSKDGTVSCATCHDPHKGFSDQAPVSTGINGQKGDRSAPSVINSAFNYFQFWDGRAPSLEEQAKGPVENPIEMGNTHEGAVDNIRAIEGYKPYFKAAFGDEEVTIDRIAKAIATYERTVLSGNSAWDRYVYLNDETAMSESAKRGLELFEGKAKCTRCHVGFNLSDSLFHNLGVGMNKENPDLGRFKVTGEEKDKGAFKTPILRDLLKTAPYMHDGSVATLAEVVELYDKGGEANEWLDVKMEPLNLSDQEKADLVAFMESLEGDWEPVDAPALPQ